MISMPNMIERAARLNPAGMCTRFEGREFSWSETRDQIARLAGALASLGLDEGDRVGILAWNCPEFIELIYAVSRAGLILVPLNARLAHAARVSRGTTSSDMCSRCTGPGQEGKGAEPFSTTCATCSFSGGREWRKRRHCHKVSLDPRIQMTWIIGLGHPGGVQVPSVLVSKLGNCLRADFGVTIADEEAIVFIVVRAIK